MPDPRCEICIRAAFNSGGVWCTEFNESIFDGSVAEECGMYDPDEATAVSITLRMRG